MPIEYIPGAILSSRVKGAKNVGLLLWILGIFTAIGGSIAWLICRSQAKGAVELEPLTSVATDPNSEVPKFGEGSLVSRYAGWMGTPVSVIVDRSAERIHFQNCFTQRKFLAVSAEPWFSCSFRDLTAAFPHNNRGVHSLVIVTEMGRAWISEDASDYAALCQTMKSIVPHGGERFNVDHPLFGLLYVGAALAGFFLSWWAMPSSTSNTTLGFVMVASMFGSAIAVHLLVAWATSIGRSDKAVGDRFGKLVASPPGYLGLAGVLIGFVLVGWLGVVGLGTKALFIVTIGLAGAILGVLLTPAKPNENKQPPKKDTSDRTEDSAEETNASDSSNSPEPPNPAKRFVMICGGIGLTSCLLLIWHFAFAKPTPVAVATTTVVTQPPIQPATPMPVTPPPPTTKVTLPANSVTQTLPPEPVAHWNSWPKDAPRPAIAPFDVAQAKQYQEAWAKHLGVPVEYTNSIGMKFRLIPPGEFTMGSTPEEIAEAQKHSSTDASERGETGVKSEGPQHLVILTKPYYLGVHEVRQQDYESVTGVNPSIFSKNGPSPTYRPNFDTSKMPVENVSWNEVTDFCSKLSVKEKLKPHYSRTGRNVTPLEGNGYRLPSEAEWEYACRAGTTTRAFFAKEEDASQFAWLANPAGGRPYPVGQLKPNPFGLFDTYGNNMEWVQDGWTPNFYEQFADKPAIDPATPFVGATRMMMRGVVWPFTPAGCRSSSRHSEPPLNRRHFFGVRAALSVEAVKVALANPMEAEALPVESHAKEPFTLKGHTGIVASVAFSPDGKRLATASIDKSVKLWDANSGQVTHTLEGHTAGVSSVVFSPDGARLASGSHDNTIKVWDTTSGKETLTLNGHTGSVTSVVFSPDGNRLATASYDQSLKVWDTTSGQEIPSKGRMYATNSVAFSRDGKWLASAHVGNLVKVWDADTGKELLKLSEHTGNVMSVAFSPDGKWLASASMDQTVKVWDVTTGKESQTLKSHTGNVTSVVFSPDGKRLASGQGGAVTVWDTASGQETMTFKIAAGAVHHVTFSPDGNRLASSGEGPTAKVWDVTPRMSR